MRFVAFVACAIWSVSTFAAADTTAAWFRETIPCEIGTKLAGYGPNDVSVAKHDDLQVCGVAVCDGQDKVLIVSIDVLGIDDGHIRDLRKEAAKRLGVPEAHVLLSCTHTHEGPHVRFYSAAGESNDGKLIDEKSLAAVRKALLDGVGKLGEATLWRHVDVGCYSMTVDENRNRRFTTADNCATFIAHRRVLHEIATGIADKELGTVVLLDPVRHDPAYVIGNYAAHALAAHSPGLGGLRISADFPFFYRRTIKDETGAEAMFVQGSAGDLVPKDDELGLVAARRTGENLAKGSMASIIDIQRNAGRFVFDKPKVGGVIKPLKVKLRSESRRKMGVDAKELEIQCVAIGDVAFVGVPGEIVNEIGLQIKWSSPFRRTFIAYCSTGYFGYMCPPNFIAAGGYEGQQKSCLVSGRESLNLVRTAEDGLFELRRRLFPEDGEEYPDDLDQPVVNLPGGVKNSKFDRR